PECRIISASCDFARVETILAGSQQTRAAALVPTREGVVFSTDTPSQQNHIYLLDRSGNLETLAELSSSSIYGCAAGSSLFFSTMAEPSSTNTAEEVRLYGSVGGRTGKIFCSTRRTGGRCDCFSMETFFFPMD